MYLSPKVNHHPNRYWYKRRNAITLQITLQKSLLAKNAAGRGLVGAVQLFRKRMRKKISRQRSLKKWRQFKVCLFWNITTKWRKYDGPHLADRRQQTRRPSLLSCSKCWAWYQMTQIFKMSYIIYCMNNSEGTKINLHMDANPLEYFFINFCSFHSSLRHH